MKGADLWGGLEGTEFPGGGRLCVNTVDDIPATPFLISVHRIATRNPRPISVAAPDRVSATTFVILRRRRLLMPRTGPVCLI